MTGDPKSAGPWPDAVVELLERTRLIQPEELATAVAATVAPLGVSMRLYLVDKEQRHLRPFPEPGRPPAPALPIDATIAGRAFATVQAISAPGRDGQPDILWLALVDGSEGMPWCGPVGPGGRPALRSVGVAVTTRYTSRSPGCVWKLICPLVACDRGP